MGVTAMRFVLIIGMILFSSVSMAQMFGGAVTDYEIVAASQTNQVIGPQAATGTTSVGDILEKVIIIPLTVGAGNVSIKDGSDSAQNIFVSGTLADLKPHVIHLGARSRVGAWQITTGANVNVIAVGRFK